MKTGSSGEDRQYRQTSMRKLTAVYRLNPCSLSFESVTADLVPVEFCKNDYMYLTGR